MKVKSLLTVAITVFIFVSCNKKVEKKIVDTETKQEITIKINRFEDILFAPQGDFRQYLIYNYDKYRYLFNTTLDNDEYYQIVEQFAHDTNLFRAYQTIKVHYPSLNSVEQELTTSFALLKETDPQINIPKVYSFILGPADFSYTYSQKAIATKDYIAFSIDLYTIKYLQTNPYYAAYPKYLINVLDSSFIVSDIMKAYLENVLYRSVVEQELKPDNDLIDIMIDRGKIYYILFKICPNNGLNTLFRYTPQQQKWIEDNEFKMWQYIIKSGTLYSKDRSKYLHFVSEGPNTKEIPNSAPRVADYYGYLIVKKYMENNKITIQEMINEDPKTIFQKSNYKPVK